MLLSPCPCAVVSSMPWLRDSSPMCTLLPTTHSCAWAGHCYQSSRLAEHNSVLDLKYIYIFFRFYDYCDFFLRKFAISYSECKIITLQTCTVFLSLSLSLYLSLFFTLFLCLCLPLDYLNYYSLKKWFESRNMYVTQFGTKFGLLRWPNTHLRQRIIQNIPWCMCGNIVPLIIYY